MKRHRLLFVDDEENILKSLVRLFADDGYEIVTATCGETALEKFNGKNISLVISDQRMPGMQGVELLSRIKHVSPHTIGILLTGYSDIKAAVAATNSGAVYKYIEKPWGDEQCRITVRRALEQYDIEQENLRLTRRIRRQNGELKQLNGHLERAKELLSVSLQRYVSVHLVDRVLNSSQPFCLSGEKRKVTILLSDIRNFSLLAETMTAEHLVGFLNQYFEAMVEVVLDNEGFLDKFIGDAIMAVFGAMYTHRDDSVRAVRVALEMQRMLKQLNEDWGNRNQPQIKIGIGIATGQVVVGNIGSKKRMDYTVIGQDVNYAQRIEGLTKILPSSILISEPTYLEVRELIEATRYGPIEIKGKKDPIVVYGVNRLKG